MFAAIHQQNYCARIFATKTICNGAAGGAKPFSFECPSIPLPNACKNVKLCRYMKKICLLICIVLFMCAVAPSVALADSATEKHVAYVEVDSGTHKYRVSSLLVNGKSVGMQLYGYYFGNSDIPVTVEIYSDSNYDFDFYLGDRNFDDEDPSDVAQLTFKQTETKRFVLNLFAQIDAFICNVDNLVNTQNAASDIYAYNNATQGEKISVDEHTFRILQLSQQMYRETGGTFNPAVYRLVDLWGFSSRIYSNGNFGLPYDRPVTADQFFQNGYPLPQQKYIDAFSAPAFTDFSENAVQLSQDGEQYFVTKNVSPAVVEGVEYQQWLDLGGIAKGYVVDKIKQMLVDCNLARYYVDSGSSSSAFGVNFGGGKFSVGFQNPYSIFTNLFVLEVSNCVYSVSGQYIRKYTVDGVEYSHIISGDTGAPAQTGLKSVFILIPESNELWASMGDCLTTALTVMGRNKFVDFVNGYLAKNGISVIAVYETLQGKREILSNMDVDSFTEKSQSLAEFAAALEKDGEKFIYNAKASNFIVRQNAYVTTIIVLACIVGAALIAIIVYQFVRGKNPVKNVQYARKDKPFKTGDILPYLAVLLVIVVLFAVVFGEEKTSWQVVTVEDMETGETLFAYNAVRKEYEINSENSRGWQVTVEDAESGSLLITFRRDFDGEQRFNQIEITRSAKPIVKMSDSLCGFHQDCVRTFGAADVSGATIVCSPNRLKVVTV